MFFKKSAKIKKIHAIEILDSRGNPTIMTKVILENGISDTACVPSGASTGSHEALELRDNDKSRYGGKGVLKACENVNTKIASALIGLGANNQAKIDQKMLELDATKDKSNLGANAILSISLACAKVAAKSEGLELYEYLARVYGSSLPAVSLSNPSRTTLKFPLPMLNLINGGQHSDSGLDIQEFMIIPKAENFSENLRHAAEIYQNLKKIIGEAGFSQGIGDEGGFAPKIGDNTKAIAILGQAVEKAGYVLGKDIDLALDCAASEFYNKATKKYEQQSPKTLLSFEELIATYRDWQNRWPIVSIEDPMAEDDFSGWKKITSEMSANTVLVGDDLFVTDVKRLQMGEKEKMANAILIKVNQIGTLTETLNCIKEARRVGYKIVISHRSGETADSFIADLAIAVGADFTKFGAPCRGERVAKYNRLLEIENNQLR